MQKTVVIHQPDFMPYLGFFQRFLHADLYIVLDHVQFVHSNRSWTHRDKIKTADGAKWLTVSVKKADRNAAINTIELSDTDWRQKNINLLMQNYRNSPYFLEIIGKIKNLYSRPFSRLLDLNMASITLLMELFDIRIPLIYSSELNPSGSKNELLVDLLQKVGATHYLSGIGARDYIDADFFLRSEIQLIWQEFNHPTYAQQFGNFLPYLSALDLLFNCGIDASRKILRGGQ